MRIPYSREREPPIPVLDIKIFSPFSGDFIEVTAFIDTGFDGGILIPFNLFEKLQLNLVEEPYPAQGVFPTGLTTSLHEALVKVETCNMRFTVHAYSTPFINKKLVGRELLNKLILTLNGPKKELEIKIPD